MFWVTIIFGFITLLGVMWEQDNDKIINVVLAFVNICAKCIDKVTDAVILLIKPLFK